MAKSSTLEGACLDGLITQVVASGAGGHCDQDKRPGCDTTGNKMVTNNLTFVLLT